MIVLRGYTAASPPPPPTGEAALARPSSAATGRTSAIYVAILEKAISQLGLGAKLSTEAGATVSRETAEAGDGSFCPRPAVSTQQHIRTAASKCWRDQFAFTPAASWAFLLRIPSEHLRLARQGAGEDLHPANHPNRKAAIGLVNRGLLADPYWRQHMSADAGIARTCICEAYSQESLEIRAPQFFCPVCRLRPAVLRWATAGARLFPAWASARVLGELISFARSKARRIADRRRGAKGFPGS